MQPKMGGKKTLRIFLGESEDIRNSLLSKREGGERLEESFKDLVHSTHGSQFEVEIRQDDWRNGIPEDLSATGLMDESWDVVVASAQGDLKNGSTIEQFRRKLSDLIRLGKTRLDAHVIVFNCSSVDPKDSVYNFFNREDTFSVRVHRFNLALFQISVAEGISIIDVERLIGQMAGERHVKAPLEYTDEAYLRICQELHRVLADIGFFEERPLVMQLGQRAS